MPRILYTLILVAALLAPSAVLATVTTSTRTVTYSPTVNTTVFAVPYPFVGKDHLVVTKITEATSAEDILTRCTSGTGGSGCDYSVRLPVGSTQGYITISPAVTSAFTIVIARTVPLTQATSFRTQGAYSARRHEDSLDKLTMIAQELRAVAGADGTTAVNTHVSESDPHDQYFILDGRSGGQHGKGGTASGENLQLSSTDHATKGKILIGSGGTELVVDDLNNRVGILTASPATPLDVNGAGTFNSVYTGVLNGGTGAGDDLWINSTAHGTDGDIKLGTDTGAGPVLSVDDLNNRVGVLTVAPDVELDVVGDVELGLETWQLTMGSDYISMATTDTAAALIIGASDGTTGGMTGFLLHPPDHATLSGQMFVYGSTINFLDDPLDSTHSYITESATYFAGTVRHRRLQDIAEVAETVTLANCGQFYTASINNTILQLPDLGATVVGCEITLTNIAASGTVEVSFSPHSSDAIYGSCVGIEGASSATIIEASGTVNKDWINTGGTANKGDHTTITTDGATGWYITACIGEWASQS